MQALDEVTEPDLIGLAATGDREAQAQLTVLCILKDGLPPVEALALAEPFARMAATHGQIEDRLMLAAVLRIRARHIFECGDLERARSLLSYSRKLCDDMTGARLCPGAEYLAGLLMVDSDLGDADADTLLTRLMSALSAKEANELRSTVNAAVKAPALEMAHHG